MRTEGKDQGQEIAMALCEMVSVLGNFQNQLQAIREQLTLRQEFNPQKLFNHLCMGEQELNRQHIYWFMEDNDRPVQEQEIRLLFSVYGYKDKLCYADFLNYVYPFDTEVIKTISTVNCKKYVKTEDAMVSEEIRCLFLMLIEKEVQFLHQFEEAKSEILPNASREWLKKSIKLVKKSLPPSFQQGVQSDYVLTFKEFKAILKKEKNITERKAQPICRRLSMQKDSFIGLDQLQAWFKPWPRLKAEESPLVISHQTLFDDIEDSMMMKS